MTWASANEKIAWHVRSFPLPPSVREAILAVLAHWFRLCLLLWRHPFRFFIRKFEQVRNQRHPLQSPECLFRDPFNLLGLQFPQRVNVNLLFQLVQGAPEVPLQYR